MRQSRNNQFKTDIVNLSLLDLYSFIIPTYQRPYVWEDVQLKKMLDDFYKAYKRSLDSIYYIGTILIRKEKTEIELIDGQQRFTTLWLVAFAFSKACPESELTKFLKKDGKLRLGFEIRHEVGEFLKDLIQEDTTAKKIYDKAFIEEHSYIRNIAKALVYISGYIEQLPKEELEGFGNYIYWNVQFIKNSAPAKTNLNKLFSTINSAGIQLEQTDIIKSNLLSIIDDKVRYSRIWEACENMNNFFERNARAAFPETDWKQINLRSFIEFDKNTFLYKQPEGIKSKDGEQFRIENISLDDLEQYKLPDKKPLDEKRESEEIYCRSIINFGQLLLHTYRLHLKTEKKEDFEGTFHINRLITIFKTMEDRKDAEEIKRFFRLLWKVRYLFDKYVIKWISDTDNKTESLELINFTVSNEEYYSRTKYAKSSSLMLQSVLYFTGDYLRQYWLTSFLGYLLNNNKWEPQSKEVLQELERIDNALSLNTSLTDKQASLKLIDSSISKDIDIASYLKEANGTSFKHYWFYKLEYILWKNWKFEKDDKFTAYKITSKNSVEHIFPQQPDNPENKIEDQHLHSFGNLVLLSVSQNSEYSNKSIGVKKAMFKAKQETYDTLKSYYIFQNEQWTEKEVEKHIQKHRILMIHQITKHYNHAQQNQ